MSATHLSDSAAQFSAYWYAFCAPFAEIDDKGNFDLSCLPADSEQALIVLAKDVRRAVVDQVRLGLGEEQNRTLVVDRMIALPGTLHPPTGHAARDYGLWACAHEPFHLNEHVSDVRADLWTPVRDDGSFVVGPLESGHTVRIRVSDRKPVGMSRATFYSEEAITFTPEFGQEVVLDVDLCEGVRLTLQEN